MAIARVYKNLQLELDSIISCNTRRNHTKLNSECYARWTFDLDTWPWALKVTEARMISAETAGFIIFTCAVDCYYILLWLGWSRDSWICITYRRDGKSSTWSSSSLSAVQRPAWPLHTTDDVTTTPFDDVIASCDTRVRSQAVKRWASSSNVLYREVSYKGRSCSLWPLWVTDWQLCCSVHTSLQFDLFTCEGRALESHHHQLVV